MRVWEGTILSPQQVSALMNCVQLPLQADTSEMYKQFVFGGIKNKNGHMIRDIYGSYIKE